MNHPNSEDWMSYLYNETDASTQARLGEHLKECPQCRERVAGWQAVQKGLDQWQLEPRRRPRSKAAQLFARPFLKWAAAAAIFAGIGFAIGRLSSFAAVSPQKLRAAIEPEIRRQLRAEFAQTMREELDKTAASTLAASREQARTLLAEYARTIENARAADNHAISAALDQLGSQETDDFVSLKKQIDTVAVLTDAGLRRTENQVAELADYSGPNPTSNTPKHKAN
jgi:hypothetical protein